MQPKTKKKMAKELKKKSKRKLFAQVDVFQTHFGSISVTAIYLQEISGQRKLDFKATVKYYMTSFLEAFLFHPIATYSALLGLYQQFSKNGNVWGDMDRKGF